MNVFRLAGDLSHLLAIIILLLKIWRTRSCAGISGRSQILFALVYTTRYLDLLSNFISLYNTVMKVVFIGASYATLYLMYAKFKATYDRNHDTFRIEFLVIPVIILALVVNHDFSPLEVLWTFSIYLESVAILPQLFLVSKTGEAETITSHYLFCLGSYRGLYILNWVYRYYSEGFYDLIAIIAGVVQTVLYCVFYLYITKAPDPPVNLTVNVIGGKVAEASWSAPRSGGYTGFKLSVVPLSEKDENIIRNNYTNHVTPFLLRDLTPGASYEVQLYSVFHGQDSSIFVATNFTTKPNTPGRSITWFRNETTLLILWHPPYPSGVFDKYRVSIAPEDALQSEFLVNKKKEGGPAQAAFFGLVPGRNYNISVQTVSQYQLSEPTRAQYRTVPLPPTNATLDINRLTPFSFDVRWDPPKQLSEFDRYQVALGIRNTVRYMINKDEERVVTFDEDLEPGETYEVLVKTMSGNVASWPVQLGLHISGKQ